MTTLSVTNSLTGLFVPVGMIGAALAVVCAVVAGIAIMRGAGGLCGGAVGVWIPAAMLSFAASFANQWIPLLVASAALATALVLGGIVRGLIRPRVARPAVGATASVAAATVPVRRPHTAPVALSVAKPGV